MNRIIIIGRLCADPEMKKTQSGIDMCNFRVAVNRRFQRDEADFFSVTTWREVAKNCHQYLKKGAQVALSGSIEMRQYEQEGVKRTAVTLNADEVEFLSRADENATSTPSRAPARRAGEMEEVDVGDMPF